MTPNSFIESGPHVFDFRIFPQSIDLQIMFAGDMAALLTIQYEVISSPSVRCYYPGLLSYSMQSLSTE